MRNFRFFIIFSLILIGCTKNVVLTDMLTGETLQGTATSSRDLEITMPDGEVLKGTYTVIRGEAVSFGSVAGYSPTGFSTMNGTAFMVSNNGQVYAVLRGDKGTIMEVQAVFSGSHGFGTAVTNRKKEYRVQF